MFGRICSCYRIIIFICDTNAMVISCVFSDDLQHGCQYCYVLDRIEGSEEIDDEAVHRDSLIVV